ncbi:MAG: S-adenosylmethionine synthetase [Bacteroidetes bacterium]|nr:MAG: S-adenosylmethionine synthetase [Bacteroidota bacterium]
MFKKLRLIVLLAFPVSVFAQFGLPPGFDVKTFQKDEDQVFWLLRYDTALMKTPVPSMQMSDPGDDLCFAWTDKKNTWHVVHGRIDSLKRYAAASHHTIDAKGKVLSSKEKPDTAMFGAHARALLNATLELKKTIPSDWRKMNRYVKRNADNSLTVWFLPSYSQGGQAFYGPEVTYYYNASGTVLSASKKIIKPLQGEKTDPGDEIELDYSSEKMPSLGSMYFAHRFKSNFKTIGIRYKKGTSTITYNTADKTHAWQHATN